jgi:hypothetical protein
MVNSAAFFDASSTDPTHSLSPHSATIDQTQYVPQTLLFLTKPHLIFSAKQIKTGKGNMVTNYLAVAT